MRRDAERAIATERVWGPGPTPGSRVLLAKPGQPLPTPASPTTTVPTADEADDDDHERSAFATQVKSLGASVIVPAAVESTRQIKEWLDEVEGDDRTIRVGAALARETSRGDEARPGLVKALERMLQGASTSS